VGILGFLAAYCLLMIWQTFIRDRHLVYSGLISGGLPFTFMDLRADFWLEPAPNSWLNSGERRARESGSPAWEYRSKLVLLGCPFIHVRVSGGLTVPVIPVKSLDCLG